MGQRNPGQRARDRVTEVKFSQAIPAAAGYHSNSWGKKVHQEEVRGVINYCLTQSTSCTICINCAQH